MTQKEMLIAHFSKGKTITFIQALGRYGIGNLKGRICELRQAGHRIGKVYKYSKDRKKKWAVYYQVER